MSENKFNETVDSLFKGMNNMLSSKTVVGEPVNINGTIIIPLIDVSFGMAAGSWAGDKKNSSAGGLGGKMTPNAVMVIKNDSVRIIPVNCSDPVSKIIDMAPDIIRKITGKDELNPEEQEAVDSFSEEGQNNE